MKYAGIDVGAETIKFVILGGSPLSVLSYGCESHRKAIGPCFEKIAADLKNRGVSRVALCGRFAGRLNLRHYPEQAVLNRALEFLFPQTPVTNVSIGCQGFHVLEKRRHGANIFRENARCSQGTGNFLRQLVERFDIDLPAADALCADESHPCALSGRCPVILKTDMTHLANRGEPQSAILAGVYDAICDNVEALVKPALCPKTVILSGGVTRAPRIQKHFEQFCAMHGLTLLPPTQLSQFYLEALGCACLAMEMGGDDINDALHPTIDGSCSARFVQIPGLKNYLSKVRRLPAPPKQPLLRQTPVFLGFDIGSTGAKAVAIACNSQDNGLNDVCWESYLRTRGNPVAAAQALVKEFLNANQANAPVRGFGVTGSGREIVGSMLSACFGASCVYILNEIAAHAEGARTIEPRVDTIFEIGGQDAKYIRLSQGRIVDAAMNEACSAGTGSFIEEQGNKFKDVKDLSTLSALALSSDHGVSLGQHCSVFMAQVIEDAAAAGIETPAILAGIYDSVILNYFYRVKGNRSVGRVVFCQGMPFCTPALAAAVVRQTNAEVIIPPNPGTIGAFGIARLAKKNIGQCAPANMALFLSATLRARHSFVCASNKGCGGTGNHCKIDKIDVTANGKNLQFTWGGACSLWDHGITSKKLPSMAPDPFAMRQTAIEHIVQSFAKRGKKTIAISEEFQLKTFFVFFATFLYDLGFDLEIFQGGTLNDLRRGLDESNVRFCAPMQHFHGVASKMAASGADYIFLPMMRCGKFSGREENAVICPVVQSSPDLLIHDLAIPASRVLSPVVDLGPGNLESPAFSAACLNLAKMLGADTTVFAKAFSRAKTAQSLFDAKLLEIGKTALDFAKTNHLPAVVVLGRNYTIHNNALNSNVPALLRAQGAMGIPVDCYPIDNGEPLYSNIYWSYGQINLRAATQIRKTPGQYAVWCSNYGCGPDSFNLHFFQFIMQGKPYALIETDGHSGDAGTKTRIEAFLHCIREYETLDRHIPQNDLHALEQQNTPIIEAKKARMEILIPPMGDNAAIAAAGFRNIGVASQMLPRPTRNTLLIGRRYTSGKECLPALITLGAILEYVQNAPQNASFVYFMPRSNGPCRLGCYNLLDKIVLQRLGLSKRIKTWSLCDTDYSEGVPLLTVILIYTGFLACDTLMAGLYDTRPVESVPGEANRIYKRYYQTLIHCIENAPRIKLWKPYVAKEIFSGTFFGISNIIKQAALEFAKIKTAKKIARVCVTGEIYVRNDPFANGDIIEALEKRGVGVSFAHFSEWIEYADIINREILKTSTGIGDKLVSECVRFMIRAIRRPMAQALGWGTRHDVHDILNAACRYLRKDLVGEEILTIGTPLHAFKQGIIDGVVSVGPLECMPSKIAESQFYHIAEHEGLISLNLSFNGDPIPDAALDDFCFEVKQRFERRTQKKIH